MRACLILPSHRQGVRLLAEAVPLSNLQLLGQTLIEYWLSYLANCGAKEVLVPAESPASHVRLLIGTGARWGLAAEVIEEPCELRPEQVLVKFSDFSNSVSSPPEVLVVEHFPQQPKQPLFASYADWFAALLSWIPYAKMADRVGLREIQPGVWVSLPCHISRRVHLRPPCWVGKHVFVGTDAVIGPGAILEEGAFIEAKSEICQSWVGADTLVGRGTRVANSIALGNRLINYETGSLALVPDPFVLCSLRQQAAKAKRVQEVAPRAGASQDTDETNWLWKTLLLHKEQ
jgi:NDP-sugar pyrophosphorylase family protein